MALLPILKFPDPKLKLVAEPIERFDASLLQFSADLFETMYANDGVGLAATQVNVQQRVFVIDLSDNKDQPLCIINPEIISAQGETIHEEGCLSFPDVYAKVKRSAEITLNYMDVHGAAQTITADSWLAICIQHEIDHLNGITFFDHLSSLKQKLIRNKLAKQRDKIS